MTEKKLSWAQGVVERIAEARLRKAELAYAEAEEYVRFWGYAEGYSVYKAAHLKEKRDKARTALASLNKEPSND